MALKIVDGSTQFVPNTEVHTIPGGQLFKGRLSKTFRGAAYVTPPSTLRVYMRIKRVNASVSPRHDGGVVDVATGQYFGISVYAKVEDYTPLEGELRLSSVK